MIEVVCDRRSRTARDLQEALGRVGLSGTLNWTGAPLSEGEPPILNARARTNKLAQLAWLELRRISVPRFSLSPKEGWLPRRIFHQQGRDFTNPPGEPDFWVEKLFIREEWRLHFFRTAKGNLRLLRSGVKIPRSPRAHPWVRSHRLGWKISYVGGAPEDAVRLSRAAVSALELDLAAVDIGMIHNMAEPGGIYQWVVLEVNTCPGLDSGTLRSYVDAITERLEG